MMMKEKSTKPVCVMQGRLVWAYEPEQTCRDEKRSRSREEGDNMRCLTGKLEMKTCPKKA